MLRRSQLKYGQSDDEQLGDVQRKQQQLSGGVPTSLLVPATGNSKKVNPKTEAAKVNEFGLPQTFAGFRLNDRDDNVIVKVDGNVQETIKVATYIGYVKSEAISKKYSSIKFVYASRHPKSPWMSNVLLPLEALQDRMNYSDEVYTDDLEMFQSNIPPFPLYAQSGKSLPKPLEKFKTIFEISATEASMESQRLHNSAGSHFALSDGKKKLAQGLGSKLYYQWLLGLTQMAKRVSGFNFDVLSRFWNKEWPSNDPLKLTVVIPKYIVIAICKENRLSPTSIPYDKVRNLVDGAVQKALSVSKFVPEVTVILKTKPGQKDGLIYIDPHPGKLYWLCADKAQHDKYFNTIGGPTKEAWRYPTETEAEHADNELGCTEIREDKNNPNESVISKETIQNAAADVRYPSQQAVMNRVSANDLVRPWWDPYNNQNKLLAEWLHRCAWSFGGLYENGQSGMPNSAQDPRNLVIGCRECNTNMIRQEAFIKRSVHYGTIKKVHVKTSISYPQELGCEPWMSQRRYIWFAPQLNYQYDLMKNKGSPDTLLANFQPFQNWVVTRFEIELDIAMERLALGWSSASPSKC